MVVQSAVKRYKVTGGGKVMVRKPGKQHINEKKSPNRLSRLGKKMQARFAFCTPLHPDWRSWKPHAHKF